MNVSDLVMFSFWRICFSSQCRSLENQYNQALAAMAGAKVLSIAGLSHRNGRTSQKQNRLGKLQTQHPKLQGNFKFQASIAGLHSRPSAPGGVSKRFGSLSRRPPRAGGYSFQAEPGQTIAFVGQTGSGKTNRRSPLAKILPPTAARSSWTVTTWRNVTSDSLRSQMGSVQQNNFFIRRLIMENIRLAAPPRT